MILVASLALPALGTSARIPEQLHLVVPLVSD
jgi:hypothetical protein